MRRENDMVDHKDLAQLQAQVEELRDIISIMPGHIYWLDRHNIFRGCNIEQAKSAKLASPNDIIGKTNYDMLWKEQAASLDAINLQVMETGTPYSCEEIALMATGVRTYLSQKVPIKNQKGEIIGLLGISVDITDRKLMEQELREAKEKAEEANQVKTEFIRNMEHDIRTPMCGILGVATYVKTKVEGQLQELLSDVEVSSNELLEYFNNILEFSQINSDIAPLIMDSISIKDIVDSVCRMELSAAKNKNLELIVSYATEIPSLLISNKFRIHRALLNLVSNAIKFTDKGYVKMMLRVELQAEDKALLSISVEDTGIGIPVTDRTIIFDKFTRGDLSNRGIYKGTGLGLWIVKQFMTELGGTVSLTSEINKGSIFTLSIPVSIPTLERHSHDNNN